LEVVELSQLNVLIKQQKELLSRLNDIEENVEGIGNKENARKISELNIKKVRLSAENTSVKKRLSSIRKEIDIIDEDISRMSGSGAERIFKAILTQRWYYFKNKPKVIMDRDTGILWANPHYFEYLKNGNSYAISEVGDLVDSLIIDGYSKWKIPNAMQYKKMVIDGTVPFHTGPQMQILDSSGVMTKNGDEMTYIWTDNDFPKPCASGVLLPMCQEISYKDYDKKVDLENVVYSESERLQFTLNLFIENDLEPIFDDGEISDLYKTIYIEKPILMRELNELQNEIDKLQRVVVLSSEFDYHSILVKYDIDSIDDSIIKYYDAVKSVTDEFMDKLNYYEDEKRDIIHDFNVIGFDLSKNHDESPGLIEDEIDMFKKRQSFLKKQFQLSMVDVKTKLLSLKKQAEDIEDRIEKINDGDNSIREIAVLEKEQRASFRFIVENASNIIKKALLKIEFFEANRDVAKNIISLWDQWSEDYKVFKTSSKDEFTKTCEDDSIESEAYLLWYEDWRKKRYELEQVFLPIIEYGLKGKMIDRIGDQPTCLEGILGKLKDYKDKLDDFYLEERKNIHQKFAFQVGGELQEKFEVESELYKLTSGLQIQLHDIVFDMEKQEDRMFLINITEKLIGLQIDEILDFIRDKELISISRNLLDEFIELKRMNFKTYITDSKAYSEELERREKEYNSLVFKMRKDLMRQ
jgi:hypothetical protein